MSLTVLLSAYACDPTRGSEYGLGWSWATELARLGHQVWVLTQGKHRAPIEASEVPPGLHFVYLDAPGWTRPWSQLESDYLCYAAWQLAARAAAQELARTVRFDLVHHVTYASIRVPSFLGGLGVPFVFGPVGGGERAPWRLRAGYPLRGHLVELLRDLSNLWVRLDPVLGQTFRRASRLVVTSEASRALVPAWARPRTHVQLAIGVSLPTPTPLVMRRAGPLELLFVGKLVFWKGVQLALRALAVLHAGGTEARLTVIGQGPDEAWLHRQARRHRVEGAVSWVRALPRPELLARYGSYDALLFPSLHDSGGMVVLEALAAGLPVLTLDLGGPGLIVDDTCGRGIATAHRTEAQVAAELAIAARALAEDPEWQLRLREGARRRAADFTWPRILLGAYPEYAPHADARV